MSDNRSAIGAIGWVDLTVENVEEVRDFYASVTGWEPEPVDMGEYHDFNMNSPENGEAQAGVCHARGANAELPPVWMIYIVVADLELSLAVCEDKGGAILAAPRGSAAEGRIAIIRDPAGAVAALYQPGE